MTPQQQDQQRVPDLLPQLRDWQRNDRSVMDKATRAFVSFVQAYSKHECKFILRLKGWLGSLFSPNLTKALQDDPEGLGPGFS